MSEIQKTLDWLNGKISLSQNMQNPGFYQKVFDLNEFSKTPEFYKKGTRQLPFEIVQDPPYFEPGQISPRRNYEQHGKGFKYQDELSIDNLMATQPHFSTQTIKHLRENEGNLNEPIDVVKFKGKHYISDGHHRALTSAMMGNKKIKANVFSETPKQG